MHSSLAFVFAGVLSNWKEARKKYIREPGVFQFRTHGEHGAGEKARMYREMVFNTFRHCVGAGRGSREPTSQLLYTLARKRLLNGRYRLKGIIEHWCPGCCRDREHALEQIDTLVIDQTHPPRQEKSSSWLSNVRLFDFFGFLDGLP